VFQIFGNLPQPGIFDTASLRKHTFRNVKLTDADTPRSFSIVDTRGFFFDANGQHDSLILRRFIMGLPEGTPFSKKNDLRNVECDSNNAVSHLVLAVNARDIYNGVTWWQSWWKQGELNSERIDGFIGLYNLMVDILAEVRYGGKKEIAKEKVALLLTHVDMMDDKKLKVLRHQLHGKLPENFLFEGRKECKWEEDDLVAHEKKVNEFLQRVNQDENKRDYFDILDQEKDKYGAGFLHISPQSCLTPDCEHRFTTRTIEGHRTLLRNIIHDV